MSPEQSAAEDKDDREQRQANRRWEPLLRKWRGWLGDGSSSRRAEAEAQLADLTDPRAVPSILKVFPIGGSEADQSRLVRLLEPIDDPRSSRALAELAVSARSTAIRLSATEVLKKRPGATTRPPSSNRSRGRSNPGSCPWTGRARRAG